MTVRESHPRLEYAASLIAARLNAMHFEWRAVGNVVEGPGTAAVIAAARHSDSSKHIDVGFVLNRTQPESHVIWDYSTGWVSDPDRALVQAIDIWAQVTAPVLLELMTRKGEFADHYHGDDPQGFAGWHAIGGTLIAWGREPGPDDLQRSAQLISLDSGCSSVRRHRLEMPPKSSLMAFPYQDRRLS